MSDKGQLMSKEEAKILLLYLLKKLNETAEKNNVKIFASGGTCLGMIRHKGMIPWDDDIDIMVFRDDLDRLVNALNQELHYPITIRTRQSDPYYFQEFVKICYLDDNGEFSDLSIDIFPLDNSNPKRKVFRWFQNAFKRNLYYAKMYKVSKVGKNAYSPKSIVKKALLQIESLIPFHVMDTVLFRVLTADKSKSDYVVNWGASYSYKKATYPKIAFGKPQKMPFENTYVWAEEEPEVILTQLYGENYMELPPEDKRTDHGVRKINNKELDINRIRKELGM